MRNEYRQDAVANVRGWEGNRRSGVALAIVTDGGTCTYRLRGLRQEEEHAPTLL